MIGVNLIPPSVLAAQRRARRIRVWAALVSVAALISALPVVYQLRQHARVASLRNQKQDQERRLKTVRQEFEEVTKALADLTSRVERADALRTKRGWAGLLGLIMDCAPDKVWLTSLSTESPGAAAPATESAGPSGEEAASQPQQVVVMAGARRLDLAGYAVGHEDLYDFMTRLKASQQFSDVELTKAGTEPALRSRAVRFELTCSW